MKKGALIHGEFLSGYKPPAMFVLSTGRSGSMMIARALAKHPALFAIHEPQIHLWTHGRIMMDRPLFLWLLAGALVSALWHVSLTMLQALNRHRRAALAYVVCAVGMVGLAWLLVDFTGQVRQAGLAMLIGDAVFALYVFWAASRITDAPLGTVLAQTLNPLALIYRARCGHILPTHFTARSRRHL